MRPIFSCDFFLLKSWIWKIMNCQEWATFILAGNFCVADTHNPDPDSIVNIRNFSVLSLVVRIISLLLVGCLHWHFLRYQIKIKLICRLTKDRDQAFISIITKQEFPTSSYLNDTCPSGKKDNGHNIKIRRPFDIVNHPFFRWLADWIESKWREFGISEILRPTYNVLLSYPEQKNPNKISLLNQDGNEVWIKKCWNFCVQRFFSELFCFLFCKKRVWEIWDLKAVHLFLYFTKKFQFIIKKKLIRGSQK